MAKKKVASRRPRASKDGVQIRIRPATSAGTLATARQRLVKLLRRGAGGVKHTAGPTTNPCVGGCEFITSADGMCYYYCPETESLHIYAC